MRTPRLSLSISAAIFTLFLTGCGQSNKPENGNENAKVKLATSQSEPLSSAEAEEKLRQASLDGDVVGVDAALEAKVNVNAMDADGRTALMFASFNGHSDIVLKLIEKGTVVDRRDLMGRTALLYAATGPFPETVSILLDKGAQPNVVDSDEHFSPLMHAAAEGHLSVVKILLKAGADMTLTDVDGDDAASFARQSGHVEVAKLLDEAAK